MAVTVGQRHVPDTASARRLYAIDAAFKLEQHTLKCCKNKKYFTDEYDDAITKKLIDAATGAYDDAYVANSIKVTSVNTWTERRDLQKSAIRKVTRMRPRLNSARRCNHLRKGKVEYWIGLVLDAQELLMKWHAADKKRYKEYEEAAQNEAIKKLADAIADKLFIEADIK